MDIIGYKDKIINIFNKIKNIPEELKDNLNDIDKNNNANEIIIKLNEHEKIIKIKEKIYKQLSSISPDIK